MKKKTLLYSLAILFVIIVLNLIFTGKVEAKTYSIEKFEIDVPSTYVQKPKGGFLFAAETSDGRKAVMVEYQAISKLTGTLNKDSLLDIVINSTKNTYGSDINITTSRTFEKNACICAEVAFSRYYNGTTYYYDIYTMVTDNAIHGLTFIAFNKNYFSSTEKTNILNSFKIKDTVTSSYGLPFTDVQSQKWYRRAVEYVYKNDIIKGLNDYTFGPDDKLSRSMMVTILYRMAGSPSVSGTSPFKDVKDSSKWYYKAVLWASKKNIVSGYSNGNFGPGDNITREQLAVMLYKYAKYRGKNVSNLGNITTFTDYKQVASYATTQVKWAVGAGVITGSNNKLNPKGNATRAEAASMLYKYCSKVGK